MSRFIKDDRGISRLVSYMLTVSIAMLLITGLLFAGGQLVEDQRDRTLQSQLTVVGHQVAGSLEAADRLVRTSADIPNEMEDERIHTLQMTPSLPERVVDSLYTIEVENDAIIVSETGPGAVSVTVPYKTHTDVATGRVSGGSIVIEYDQSDQKLVINNA